MLTLLNQLDFESALLLGAMLVLALFSLVGGLVLLALSYVFRSAGRLDPNFKEPRNEC